MTTTSNPFVRPLGPIAAAGWAAALLVVFLILGTLLVAIRPGSEVDSVNATLLYTASALVILWILVRVHAPDAPLRDVLGARPIGFLPALLATAMGACASFPLTAAEAWLSRRYSSMADAAEFAGKLATLGRTERIAGEVALMLIAPIGDELLFRGALASGVMRDRGRNSALLTTAFTFAMISASNNLHFAPVYLVMGVMLGYARLSTGSVLAAIGAHVGYRAAGLAASYRAFRTIDPVVTGGGVSFPLASKITIAAGVASLGFAFLLSRVGEGEQENEPRAPRIPPDEAASGGDE